jgi:hypothetical protein
MAKASYSKSEFKHFLVPDESSDVFYDEMLTKCEMEIEENRSLTRSDKELPDISIRTFKKYS